jgi:hypothetical protein
MNITVNELDSNVSLDQTAMESVLGGWHNHGGSTTSYTNHRSTGWSSWMNSGIPFTQKRYRDRYRTRVVTTKQHHRDWQFKTTIGIGF